MKVMVNWYKPSGKWYSEGEVEIGGARLWHGFRTMLEAIWMNQTTLSTGNKQYWTIVVRDHPDNEKDPNYHEFTHAVLQVGRDD